jgi:hypothetical protein
VRGETHVFLFITIIEGVFDADQSAISKRLVWGMVSQANVDIANFRRYVGNINIQAAPGSVTHEEISALMGYRPLPIGLREQA